MLWEHGKSIQQTPGSLNLRTVSRASGCAWEIFLQWRQLLHSIRAASSCNARHTVPAGVMTTISAVFIIQAGLDRAIYGIVPSRRWEITHLFPGSAMWDFSPNSLRINSLVQGHRWWGLKGNSPAGWAQCHAQWTSSVHWASALLGHTSLWLPPIAAVCF